MAEPAHGTATGTRISERTSDLVLPSDSAPDSPSLTDAPERKAGLSDPPAAAAPSPQTPQTPQPPQPPQTPQTPQPSQPPQSLQPPQSAPAATTNIEPGDPAIQARESQTADRDIPNQPIETQRGIALPGDRGPRTRPAQAQRPSFWRRIALGGRKANAARSGSSVEAATSENVANITAVETRIVEPLLQALVSVEAKLERSHVDLIERSDSVEQRLTQLWDIEEQLGALNEFQESLLNVSEQHQRLARAVESQTRTLRWLVASIFFSLTAAAFVVAAVLR